MTARDMVRNLRENGALGMRTPGSGLRSSVLFFVTALAFGAVLYIGTTMGLPSLIEALEKKPPPVEFAKKLDD